MFEWAQIINSIQTLSGVPRVSLTTHLDSLMGSAASPRQIRDAMKQDLAGAWSHYKPYQDIWNATGKKGLAPGMSEDAMHVISSIMRSNPNTGEMPHDPDAPPQVRAISKDPSKANRKLTDEQKRTPYTSEQMRAIASEYKAVQERLKVERDPKLIEQDQFNLETLAKANGTVLNGPWEMGY
jgi:hypothetical protein